MKFPTYEEMAKDVAEKALDEILYDGKSLREWAKIIASEDAISRQAAINLIESIETERLKGNVELIYAPAIKGLRALPPVTSQPCGDAISRQAAINAMIKLEQDDIVQYGCKIPEGFDSSPAIEVLEGLQPVTPQPKVGHWYNTAIQGEIDGQIVRAFSCSECGAISIFRMTGGKIVNGDLCPNCRANMEEVKK